MDGSSWQPTKYSKICSAHFIDNAKSEHPLHPSYLPTIFPSDYIKQPRPNNQAKERSLFQNFETFIMVQLKKKIIILQFAL